MRPSVAGLLGTLLLVGGLASPLAHAQQTFGSPEAAADAFTEALRKAGEPALAKVLGGNYKQFVNTEGVERADIETYLAAWDKQHKVNTEGDKAVVVVGAGGWTLPIPIAKHKAGWQFDVAAGADEMRTRRIGRNELATMQAILAYYDAQREYSTVDHNGDGIYEYAQKFVSTKGKKDGLYWEAPPGSDESPLGPLLAQQKPGGGTGYHGYRYKILTSQGPSAAGGARDYLVGGKLLGGFAVIAWPARYRDTGVMSFMVNQDGQVYESDLGADTAAKAAAMKSFDPGLEWRRVSP